MEAGGGGGYGDAQKKIPPRDELPQSFYSMKERKGEKERGRESFQNLTGRELSREKGGRGGRLDLNIGFQN